MKYKRIVFILILILLILTLLMPFLIKINQARGEIGQLGMSKPNCREDFKSAGVYDETLGIYNLTCVAEVSSEYGCQKWQFVVGKEAECLREK